MIEKENIIIRFFKWFLKRIGILETVPISKEYMCEQAQDVCNHECANCAWNYKDEAGE